MILRTITIPIGADMLVAWNKGTRIISIANVIASITHRIVNIQIRIITIRVIIVNIGSRVIWELIRIIS